MEKKGENAVIFGFSTFMIMALFTLFYLATGSSIVIYVFSSIYILFLGYFWVIYASDLPARTKLAVKILPLTIVSITIGGFFMIAGMAAGIVNPFTFSGLLLLVPALLSIMHILRIFTSSFLLKYPILTIFNSGNAMQYDLEKIYGLLISQTSVIVFSKKQDYEDYVLSTKPKQSKRLLMTANREALQMLENLSRNESAVQDFGSFDMPDTGKLRGLLSNYGNIDDDNLWKRNIGN